LAQAGGGVIVSDKTQFVLHHATGKWLPTSNRMALIDLDMDYKAAADDDPSLIEQRYMQEEIIQFLTDDDKHPEVFERMRVRDPALHEQFQISLKKRRALIYERERGLHEPGFKVADRKRLSAPSPRMVNVMVQILDLALDPEKADGVIFDLLEQYPRRLAFGPGHAKRWLVAQTVRVIFGRALAVIRQVAAARAGK
jgi:hypothetical protein